MLSCLPTGESTIGFYQSFLRQFLGAGLDPRRTGRQEFTNGACHRLTIPSKEETSPDNTRFASASSSCELKEILFAVRLQGIAGRLQILCSCENATGVPPLESDREKEDRNLAFQEFFQEFALDRGLSGASSRGWRCRPGASSGALEREALYRSEAIKKIAEMQGNVPEPVLTSASGSRWRSSKRSPAPPIWAHSRRESITATRLFRKSQARPAEEPLRRFNSCERNRVYRHADPARG